MNGELEQLFQRLQSIEEKLEQLHQKPVHQHIHIQQMTVYDPYLENLIYRLDRIQVKDLSGSLNIGNNFDMVTKEKKAKEKQQTSQKKQESKMKERPSRQVDQKNDEIQTASISQIQTEKGSTWSKHSAHEEQQQIEQTHMGFTVKIDRKKRRG